MQKRLTMQSSRLPAWLRGQHRVTLRNFWGRVKPCRGSALKTAQSKQNSRLNQESVKIVLFFTRFL